jgi:hypothetical protein
MLLVMQHQMTLKIGIPLTLTLSVRTGEGKKLTNEIIPSPLMGEGEDEGDYFKTHYSLHLQDRTEIILSNLF